MFTNVFTLSTITTESHHRHGVSYLRVKIFKWEWCQPWLWYLSEMMWHSQSRAHSPSVSVTQINQNSLPGHSFAYKKPELPFFHHNRCFSNPPGEETPSFLSKTWMPSNSLTFCTFPLCIFSRKYIYIMIVKVSLLSRYQARNVFHILPFLLVWSQVWRNKPLGNDNMSELWETARLYYK